MLRRLGSGSRVLLWLAVASACASPVVCNCPNEQASGVQVLMFSWLHVHSGSFRATMCALARCSTTQVAEGDNDAFVGLPDDVSGPADVTLTIADAGGRSVLTRKLRVRPEHVTYSCCGQTSHSSIAQVVLDGKGNLVDTTPSRS